MSERSYIQHGRRHGTNGSDPIPHAIAVGYLWGVDGTPVSVNSATPTLVPWDHFQTTDSSIFGTDTTNSSYPGPYNNASGDTYLYLNARGAYLVVGACQWESGAFEQAMTISPDGSQYVLDVGGSAVSFPQPVGEEIATNVASILGVFSLFAHRMIYTDGSSSPGILSMSTQQTSGGAKNLVNASLGIFYLGNDDDLASVY